MGRCDALVVGGGLAGAAVATLLARAGRTAVLLEKTRGAHDKVCGEFLSAEALHSLRVLSVDPAALGAVPIETVRLTRGRRTVEQPLPFAAMSLSRRVLDEALLAAAVAAGAVVCQGASVESLEVDAAGEWTASTSDGDRYTAPVAFAATGKHDLRGHARRAVRSFARHDGLLGFKMYFRLDPAQARALHGTVEVSLFRHGYCGLQLVEGGSANLCLLVRREHYQGWSGLLARMCDEIPLLGQRLDSAKALLLKPLALSHIPYGFQRTATPPGLWAVGDQAAVIPSFSGDGMSIALHSGVVAARACLAGEDASAYQASLARQLRLPIMLATAVSRALVSAPAMASVLWHVPGVMRQIALRTRVPQAGTGT